MRIVANQFFDPRRHQADRLQHERGRFPQCVLERCRVAPESGEQHMAAAIALLIGPVVLTALNDQRDAQRGRRDQQCRQRGSVALAHARRCGHPRSPASAQSTGPADHHDMLIPFTGGRPYRAINHACSGGASGVSVRPAPM